MNIGSISKKEIREILFKETKGRCMVCGKPREECDNWSCTVIQPKAPRGGTGPEEMTILCQQCVSLKRSASIPDAVNSRPFRERFVYWWNVHKAFCLGRITAYKRGKLMDGFHLFVPGKSFPSVAKQTTIHNAIFEETRGCCIYCGQQLTIGHFTIDHIVPRYYGGGNYAENLVTACDDCNQAKGNKPVHDYVSSFSYRQLKAYANRVKYLESHGDLSKRKAKRLLNFENAHTHRKRICLFNRLYTFSVTVEEL